MLNCIQQLMMHVTPEIYWFWQLGQFYPSPCNIVRHTKKSVSFLKTKNTDSGKNFGEMHRFIKQQYWCELFTMQKEKWLYSKETSYLMWKCILRLHVSTLWNVMTSPTIKGEKMCNIFYLKTHLELGRGKKYISKYIFKTLFFTDLINS